MPKLFHSRLYQMGRYNACMEVIGIIEDSCSYYNSIINDTSVPIQDKKNAAYTVAALRAIELDINMEILPNIKGGKNG